MATNAVETGETQEQSRTAKVKLPFGLPELHAPDVRMPRVPKQARHEMSAALDTARSFLPPPRQLVYYGALGVLTAVELIEWPVAIAIGVGTAVAGRGRESRAAEPGARTAPVKPVEKRRAPQDRVRPAGQPETAGAHQPTKRVTSGERPSMAGQPEIAGAHHPLAERTPPQAGQPEPAVAKSEPAAAKRRTPKKPETAPAQRESRTGSTPARLQPAAPAPSGEAAKSGKQDSNSAPGGE
ncbi:hypothetical protein [Amycolatopsis sp. NPDC051372]|uniref:hypothetical protein n=1 Tax=unclassified Amycolatopsis TaxID=2618356 RepID=UPI0034499764